MLVLAINFLRLKLIPISFGLLFPFFSLGQVFNFEPYASGFINPVTIANDNLGNLYIGENAGKIIIILPDGSKSTFLDITSHVNGNFSGIHGLAIDPNYAANGFLYIKYVNGANLNCYISRFSRDPNNQNKALENSELVLLQYPDWVGHLGGNIEFGKDGFLYFATGDGAPGARGSIGDEFGNSQNLNSVKGKLMRIDVSNGSLAFPQTNPHLMPNDNIPNEIIGVGLRNPWKFSFDQTTGDLWIGDVGQDDYEEIDFVENGSFENTNFGWSCYEGLSSHIVGNCPTNANFVSPAFNYAGYNHNGNKSASVTGGYVYRGSLYPTINGWYFFADYASNDFWKTKRNNDGSFTTIPIGKLISNPVAFGQDNLGEIYVASYSTGTIYKLKVTCETQADINQTQNTNAVIQVSDQINASSLVSNNLKIDYFAGGSINLLPGFEVNNSSIFRAQIKGCP